MLFQNRILTNNVPRKKQISKIVRFFTIPCISVVLFIGCRTPNPDANNAKDDITDMVLIPAGEFEMGNNDTDEFGPHGPQENESPVHTVYVDAFYIDKYEVTNADFKKFLDANPKFHKNPIAPRVNSKNSSPFEWIGNNYPEGQGNYPVHATWHEAMAYATWAGKRLPTEAEWEKAARGGLKNKIYPTGDSINTSMANYEVNHSTFPVGSYAPNGFGLYDMAGNVQEWCLDEYQSDFYKNSPDKNPIAGTDSITDLMTNYRVVKSPRILRGGGWVFGPAYVTVSRRYSQPPEEKSRTIGFRCVKQVKR